MRHIPRHVWERARDGVRILHELGSGDEALAVERLIDECKERGDNLAADRARQKIFRDKVRAKVQSITVKCALALGENDT